MSRIPSIGKRPFYTRHTFFFLLFSCKQFLSLEGDCCGIIWASFPLQIRRNIYLSFCVNLTNLENIILCQLVQFRRCHSVFVNLVNLEDIILCQLDRFQRCSTSTRPISNISICQLCPFQIYHSVPNFTDFEDILCQLHQFRRYNFLSTCQLWKVSFSVNLTNFKDVLCQLDPFRRYTVSSWPILQAIPTSPSAILTKLSTKLPLKRILHFF